MDDSNYTEDLNYQFLKSHWDDLLKAHPLKYVVISEGKLWNTFDTYEAAANAAYDEFHTDTPFFIHQMTPTQPLNLIIFA